jgi:hypothetical protein
MKECDMASQSCPYLLSLLSEALPKCHTPVRPDVFEVRKRLISPRDEIMTVYRWEEAGDGYSVACSWASVVVDADSIPASDS